jgi:adenylate cyclase
VSARPDTAAAQALVDDVSRRLERLYWFGNAVGTAVIAAAAAILLPVFTESAERSDLAVRGLPAAVVLFVVVGLGIRHFDKQAYESAVAWIEAGRTPSEAERRRTLSLGWDHMKVTAYGWVAGAVVYSVGIGIFHSWDVAAVLAATGWLGAETTCALLFLASERILRPLTALALADGAIEGTAALSVRTRLGMAWLLGTGVPLLGMLVVAAAGLLKPGVDGDYVAGAELFLGAVATGAGLLATLFAGKAIAHPVTAVRDGLRRIEQGELDTQVTVDDASEVGQLQAGFNRMAGGLRERERIRDLFGRQVGEEVARAALDRGTRLGGEEREVGAFFIDLVGSTSMALAMPPSELVRVLNKFFRVVVEQVEADGGLVNKFQGDAALCVFGAPVPRDDPAGDALRSARCVVERLRHEVPEVDFGIGVSAGVAVAGNVGAENRFEYTVIGDPINEAARLAELAKEHSDRVLASAAALRRSHNGESDSWAREDPVFLRGRNAPTGIAHPASGAT